MMQDSVLIEQTVDYLVHKWYPNNTGDKGKEVWSEKLSSILQAYP